LTPVSRFRSQPSDNTAVSTIHSRLSCYDANWRKHAEIKGIVTRMPCPHALWLSKCWNVF